MKPAAPAPDGLLRIATAPLALPAGMRDLLPPRAAQRRTLARTLLAHFERYGYELVVPPAFEREDVVARGLSERARRDLVRFTEPETGDVMVLRPDMTPQIARIAATRYRDTPGPLRFMYDGTVVRRPRGRARRHRQISQAGIECIGWADTAADVEVMHAALGALDAAGLADVRLELGHAALGEFVLRDVPAGVHDLVVDALSARDTATLARLLGSAFHASSPLARALELSGGADVLARAERALPDAACAPFHRALRDVHASLAERGLADRVLIDLAEVRGLGYYTGVAFQLLAEGPGEPLGAGGRYDALLGRYGAEREATGFGLDLEHVEWALGPRVEGVGPTIHRVLIGGADRDRARSAEALRARGLSVAECSLTGRDAVLGLAHEGGYDAAFLGGPDGPMALDAVITAGA